MERMGLAIDDNHNLMVPNVQKARGKAEATVKAPREKKNVIN